MNIFEQLRRDEGVRLKPYKDTVGKLTIGVGRNLDDVGLSEQEVDYLLAQDVHRVERDLEDKLPWCKGLDEPRYMVLVNMAFNMGIASLLKFKMTLNLIEHNEYEAAADEMLRSKWAEQVGERAKRLAKQMEKGVWV